MRYRTKHPNDEEELTDGDGGFLGVDMFTPPRLVQPGFVCSATNKRFNNGKAQTRLGLFPPMWGMLWSKKFPYRSAGNLYITTYNVADYVDSGWPGDVRVGFRVGLAGMPCYGVGFFSDPGEESEDWIVRVGPDGLYFARETEVGRFVPFADSTIAVSAPVQVVQNFNQLIISRGDGSPTLAWSGNWVDPVRELERPAPASPIYAMPASLRAVAWRERLWIIAGRDELVASQLADNTRYTTDNDFMVNQGAGDALRALAPFGDYSLLIFKSRSLHLLTAAKSDLTDAVLDQVPCEISFASPNAIARVGTQLWWLDHQGIRSAQLVTTADGRRTAAITIVSQPIDPLIKRINWAQAEKACAAVWNNRVYFAVPLDQDTYPRSVLVYNLLTQQWEGRDIYRSSDIDIAGLVVCTWLGAPKLFLATSGMGLHCCEYIFGEDITRNPFSNGTTPDVNTIVDEVITRGYSCGDATPKSWTRCGVRLESWGQGYNTGGAGQLLARFGGQTGDLDLGGPRRSPNAFMTLAPAFVSTNADGRYMDAQRQDYASTFDRYTSLRLDTTAGGIQLENLQAGVERRRLAKRESGYVQLIVRNPVGVYALGEIEVTALSGPRQDSNRP